MDYLDIEKIRKDFPILNREIEGNRLIYLDNTATSQIPERVVDKIDNMYYHYKLTGTQGCA